MVKREGGGGGRILSQGSLRRAEPPSSQPSQRRNGGLPPRQQIMAPSSQPTQPSQSQRPSSQTRDDDPPSSELSGEEMKKLVAEVMRHMLFKNHQQPNVPVRRDELARLITTTYKQHNLPTVVISQAQKKMLSIFGFNMKEYVRVKSAKAAKSANAGTQADVKEYVLESSVPEAHLRKYIETPGTAAVTSLAVLVVGVIKYSGGEKVPEETVMQSLERMGIREADANHPVFGNMKNALETLSKQRYIQKEKLTGHDGDGFVYDLAERALDESFQRRLGEFMAKIDPRDNARDDG
ncbi:unnamed protein product [Calypogeia fissa]